MEQELIPIGIKEECEKAVKELVDGAVIEKIDTIDQYHSAGALTKQVRGSLKLLKEKRELLTQPLESKKKSIIAYFKPLEIDLERIKTNVDNVIGEYHREEERKRIEQQKKLEEEARKQKQKEIDAANKKREEEERKRKEAEEAKKKAEQESDDKKKAELLAEANKLESQADKDSIAAQFHEDSAGMVVVNQVDKSDLKIKGVSHKPVWIAHVVNIEACLKWCLENKQFGFITINDKAIGDVATKLSGNFNVPGINFKKEFKTRGRAA